MGLHLPSVHQARSWKVSDGPANSSSWSWVNWGLLGLGPRAGGGWMEWTWQYRKAASGQPSGLCQPGLAWPSYWTWWAGGQQESRRGSASSRKVLSRADQV